ncbi:MAG TPA: ATP-binding protein [Polyangiaceae bacterium]|nr:ATP-binding protein [Polyangiaceae bacterium]
MAEPRQRSITQERSISGGPARLIVIEGPQAGQKFKIDGDVVLGRAIDAAIVLEDPEVSRSHARITRNPVGAYLLEDLQSRNGTLINGIPVQKQCLAFGDKIQVGPRVLILFAPFDPIEDQLLQRQRLEALGRVGAGVAHDLNNMLGAISASIDFLARLPSDRPVGAPDVKASVADIRSALQQASELARGILKFARGRSRGHALVDISVLCQEVIRLARHTFDRAIVIEQDIRTNLVVSGDQAELHQVIMNLCLNARDAMPTGGTLRIVAELVQPEPSDRAQVAITIEDSGSGMDSVTRSRIFEPFFTTKPEGAGFGLGLSTVREVVDMHGGQVNVESELGKGTSFILRLPASAGQPMPVRITGGHRELRPNNPASALILLVDDEEVVRRSTARLLRQAGHQVLEAPGGKEATSLYLDAEHHPDLVILDLDMPHLNGEQTQRLILSIDPKARILFMSGHDDFVRENSASIGSAAGYLRKPCNVALLLATVSDVLHPERLSAYDEQDERTRPGISGY